ncbi:MAG: membrane protein insertase YidC, partial [Alphaproteobacteria bacterium]|nr:membrane protein insertase YidC [Alphaproteobacteria bacterium]
AIILSMAILLGFQYFYVKPQQEAERAYAVAHKVIKQVPPTAMAATQKTEGLRPRAEILKGSSRVTIDTPALSGSIDLRGARFDDLLLSRYRETEDKNSPPITLLSPSGSAAPHLAYYAEFSWLSDDAALPMPGDDTMWEADSTKLSPSHPVTLTWSDGKGLTFVRTIAVDDHYMFTVTDRVANASGKSVTLYPFGLVARQGESPPLARSIVLQGGLGVLDGTLEEYKYASLIDDGKKTEDSTGGWLGITDKYWLVAMIPPQDEKITAEFAYNRDGEENAKMGFFQSDFRGSPITIAPGASAAHAVHLFAGAKQVNLLDSYADKYDIPHFDKAIDFGWFYFLTKPFLYLLEWLSGVVGNTGIAILLFTVLLKLATLPLSLKSYHSMSRMKALQPELKSIQERFADDKMRQSQEMMELYKREKVSPMSGCVPTLVQIPIFFALYKVLYVNIEMRHAPFFGWIHDMSAPDPTSLFNLFGLLHFTPPALLQLGAWPILMGCSMFLQQKMSPQPPDKSQARMFMFMPIIFTFMLAHMPAGLVIYWTWSNLIGIAQQWYIMKRDLRRKAGRAG